MTYLLLETGGRLTLEDASGALLAEDPAFSPAADAYIIAAVIERRRRASHRDPAAALRPRP